LNIVQLARETALERGRQAQAERLSPVVTNLQNVVKSSRQVESGSTPTGILAQEGFDKLLEAAKNSTAGQRVNTSLPLAERNQVIHAMSSSQMSDSDIARYLGMSREEVRMVISVGQTAK
jgi:DNA-binding NtrC family response regulator